MGNGFYMSLGNVQLQKLGSLVFVDWDDHGHGVQVLGSVRTVERSEIDAASELAEVVAQEPQALRLVAAWSDLFDRSGPDMNVEMIRNPIPDSRLVESVLETGSNVSHLGPIQKGRVIDLTIPLNWLRMQCLSHTSTSIKLR